MKHLIALLMLASVAAGAGAEELPVVQIETNLGAITVELDYQKAPRTVENFLNYAREGHYNGTLFHRVIPDYMIQGGLYTEDYQKKTEKAPIQNEANNGLQNLKGALAMARGADPHSAAGQFFINLNDNAALDYKAPTRFSWGYAVFGKVTAGMDVVEKMQAVETGAAGPLAKNVPVEPIVIQQVVIQQDLSPEAQAAAKAAAKKSPAPAAKPAKAAAPVEDAGDEEPPPDEGEDAEAMEDEVPPDEDEPLPEEEEAKPAKAPAKPAGKEKPAEAKAKPAAAAKEAAKPAPKAPPAKPSKSEPPPEEEDMGDEPMDDEPMDEEEPAAKPVPAKASKAPAKPEPAKPAAAPAKSSAKPAAASKTQDFAPEPPDIPAVE
jgi:cyclophilin family peptidyl-prolyl cis-trans isomerase